MPVGNRRGTEIPAHDRELEKAGGSVEKDGLDFFPPIWLLLKQSTTANLILLKVAAIQDQVSGICKLILPTLEGRSMPPCLPSCP